MLEEIAHIEATADLLYSETDVEAAIKSMAHRINTTFADKAPVILCVLNGGVVVTGKLLTQLNFPFTFDAINASRYLNNTVGGEIKWLVKPQTELQGRHVLIVDDILDQGVTLSTLVDYCKQQNAQSVHTAVLLDKKILQPKPLSADFVGLEVEDRYLFGYGLDYKGYLRNLPGIYACRLENS